MNMNKNEYIYVPVNAEMSIPTETLVELYLQDNTCVKTSFSTHEEAMATIRGMPDYDKAMVKHISMSRVIVTNKFTHNEIIRTLRDLTSQANCLPYINNEEIPVKLMQDIADINYLCSKDPNAFINANLIAPGCATTVQKMTEERPAEIPLTKDKPTWQLTLPHERRISHSFGKVTFGANPIMPNSERNTFGSDSLYANTDRNSPPITDSGNIINTTHAQQNATSPVPTSLFESNLLKRMRKIT